MTSAILTLLDTRRARAFRTAGLWGEETIYQLVRAQAQARPNAVALTDRLRRVSYADLVAAADRLAASLQAQGLRAGQRLAVWLPSRIETAVALLACSRNDYVCCPSLHRDHTVAEVVSLLKRMRASGLIAERGYGADGGRHDLFARSQNVESLSVRYPLEPLSSANDKEPLFAALKEIHTPSESSTSGDPDSIVYLAFTSGTTGEPKGVMHSDNTLLANARQISKDWTLFADSVVYSMSPLSHNLGFGAMIMTLMRGGRFVVHDLERGRSAVDRIIETKATFVIGVPTHAIDVLSEMRTRELERLGEVRGFRVSGTSVPSSVVADLIAHGVTPQSGYGMTEAGSHHYTLPDDDQRLVSETSGRACAGYEVRIFAQDDPDRELPVGEIGQIGGRGASLMLGYFDNQSITEQSLNASGWFMTGDVGWLDEAGYLRVTGRKKDIIIRGGHNIYPAKIESLALRCEAVDQAAAVPVADERLGEKVCLVVAPRQGRSIEADVMLEHLDACGLSKFDMPEYFVAVDAMPLTTSGKILKRDLVLAIQEGRIRPQPVRFKPVAST